MANTILKPDLITDTAIKFLEKSIVLAPTIWTNGLGDFAGRRNDTVNIRVELPGTAYKRDLRATGEDRKIQLGTLNEISIPVRLTERIESAVPVTDEELSLDIVSFAQKIVARQVRAIVQQYETDVATLIEGAPYETELTIDANKPYDAFVDATTQLNIDNVDTDGRTLVVGPKVAAALRKSPQWSDASVAGDANAFRHGALGTIDGLTPVVGSNHIDPNSAYLFHQTAFVAANRAPAVPQGAVSGASTSSNGLAIRWLRDYDADYATDRSILTVYTGFGTITEDTTQGVTGPFKRGVKLSLPASGS